MAGGGALIAAAMAGGVLFGDGIARTVVNTSDGSTWLGDDRRGDVVQVNPTTGKQESRLHIGTPDSDLDVRQRDGLLVVIDRKSGTVTLIDLATLLTTGRRQVSPGDATEVMLDGNRTYLVDRKKGTVANIDAVSANTIGQEWRAPAGALADAGVDGASVVWALDDKTNLHKLTWSDDVNRFVEQGARTVQGSGGNSVVVTHDHGATVLGPEGGVMVQVDTDTDRAIAVPGLASPLHGAEKSPADLVPAAVEPSGTVVLLRGAEVLEVGVNGVRCDRPGEPAVLERLIYVPCLGARKVIVLNDSGRAARPDIVTPEGGDPELVLDDGRIMVNVPGAETGVVIDPDGSTRTVSTYSPDGRAPNSGGSTGSPPPPEEPPALPPRRPDLDGVLPDLPALDGMPRTKPPLPPTLPLNPPTQATTTPPAPKDPPTPEEVLPTAVTALARPDGSVLVSWTPGPERPNRYNVFFQATKAGVPVPGGNTPLVAQAPGKANSAVVTTLAPGTVGSFFVLAVPPGYQQGQKLPSSPLSNEVTTFTRPAAPVSLRVRGGFVSEEPAPDGRSVMGLLTIQWNAPAENGRSIQKYRVTVRGTADFTQTTETTGRTTRIATMPCDNPGCVNQAFVVEVIAVNEAGPGEPARLQTVLNEQRRVL